MWKRLNRSKEPTISSPTPLETSLPAAYLESIPEVRSPTSEGESPGLPPLPFRAVPPLEHMHPSFADRASSVYSQPSPGFPHPGERVASSIYSHDVSPPDSPTQHSDGSASSPNISPVDNVGPDLLVPRQNPLPPRSNIPLPQKPISTGPTTIKKFGNSPGWRRDPVTGLTTRWDEYSGEPTTGEKGRPASVNPGTAEPFAATRQKSKQLFSAFRDRDPSKRKGAEKQHRVQDDPSSLPPERPPWKGASGRATIVTAVRDNPTQRMPPPLQIPQSGSASTIRATVPEVDEANYATKPNDLVTASPSNATSPRHNVPIESQSPEAFISSLHSNPVGQPAEGPASLRAVDETTPERQFTADNLDHLRDLDLDDQPASRFSATTVATTVYDSPTTPRASVDIPPVPVLPPQNPSRYGPIVSPGPRAMWQANMKNTTRKPTPSERASSIYSTTSNTSKSLPQCPPESQATDKISSMEARLDDLSRRRRNIDKIIKELTHVINPSSPGYDLKTKADLQKTVASLNDELAEIGQEEHDVGLKLHRAQKKRDKEDIYGQPTTLWIKRVTS